MSNEGEKFMHAFIDIVHEEATEKGYKIIEFARLIWPDAPSRTCKDRWQRMRKYNAKSRLPQGVLIADAFNMARVLEIDLSILMERAELKAKYIKAEK